MTVVVAFVAFMGGFTLAAILATGRRTTPEPGDMSYGGTDDE